jgi:NAD(P)-dependent dehydrogenase (short-subunit alcohol dehydrogenase family)
MTAQRGRVALVTGANGGIGTAIVQRLERDGWTVAASMRDKGAFEADVRDSTACARVVGRVVAEFGRLDLLVNNAAYMRLAPVDEQDVEDWWHVVDVNLGGSFYMARASADALREAKGHIVNLSSRMGVAGDANGTAYTSSKAGLIGLTKALALELAPDVRVNALAPGPVDTQQLGVDALNSGRSLDEEREARAKESPLKRLVSAEEIAGTIAFLVSDDAAEYTGQVFSPNGGRLM